jgi:hypothetical protein
VHTEDLVVSIFGLTDVRCSGGSGLFCATLYLQVKQQTASSRMDLAELLEECRFLSDLLRIEVSTHLLLIVSKIMATALKSDPLSAPQFVFPTDSLEVNVRRTIATLEADGVVSSDATSVGLSADEISQGRERYDFYLFLLWPFVEA